MIKSLPAEILSFDLIDATPNQAYSKAGGSLYVALQPRLGSQESPSRSFCVGHTRGEEYPFGACATLSLSEAVYDAKELLIGVYFHHRKIATGNPAIMALVRDPISPVDQRLTIKVTEFFPGTQERSGTVKAKIAFSAD